MPQSAVVFLAMMFLSLAGCTWLEGTRSSRPPMDTAPVLTRDVVWHGWNAIEQTNGLITLRHVPGAGGRTLSLEIGGDDAFLVFPEHRGKAYPVDARDNSVHFGGHYTCIGPERTWNVHEQPFNPHAGPYRVERHVDSPDRHRIRLVSEPGTWMGATIAIEREITVERGSTRVAIDEHVINRGPDPLEFYIWDFTQIDAVNRHQPDERLRNLTFYVPVPRAGARKDYTVFFERDPRMLAQFDESLDADVLAIHFAAVQFKIASHARDWWVAAVDHDTGWTYVKAFKEDPHAKYVDGNGPIEVYGSFMDQPMGQPFVEMELLGGIEQHLPGHGPEQREHWYATNCAGPVLELTPVGVVCEPLKVEYREGVLRVTGRFGGFYQGIASLRLADRKDQTVSTPVAIKIDPREEIVLDEVIPAGSEAVALVLDVFDYRNRKVGELARVSTRK